MKKTSILLVVSALTALTACSKSGNETTANTAKQSTPTEKQAAPAQTASAPTQQALPAGHPKIENVGAAPAAAATHKGKVLSVTHAAGYTYLEVEEKGRNVWLATAPVNTKAGDTISWGGGAVMHNFTSKTLHRTFDEIVFLQTVNVVK